MSLIADLDDLKRACNAMQDKARKQQRIYFRLREGIVWMHQEHRIAKNYSVSDALRSLLSEVGIEVVQGTAAYKYEEIPERLKGRQVDDTWRFFDEKDL